MGTDTLQTLIDTVKTTAVQLVDKPLIQETSTFDWEKTLFTALIGAIIGQLLIIVITWIKNKIELNDKKKLLISDLENQKETLIKLKAAYQELIEKFESRNTSEHSYESFKDLHTDIFNALSKTDLYKIFGKKYSKIVNIYKTIEFLTESSVDTIYRDYLMKLSNHLKEKKDKVNHEYYCVTHIGFIDMATRQLKNNIRSIDTTIPDINNYLK